MSAVGINQAARQLGKSPATVRRWIAEGAPCVTPGEVGRGHGAKVNPDELLRWRHGVKKKQEAEFLQLLASALWDFYRRDSGIDAPAHRTLGIRDTTAAALYVTQYEFIAQRLGQPDLEPEEIAQLRAICLS